MRKIIRKSLVAKTTARKGPVGGAFKGNRKKKQKTPRNPSYRYTKKRERGLSDYCTHEGGIGLSERKGKEMALRNE